jgi:hypothetical protein
LLFAALLLFSLEASADALTPAKRADILKLLEVTGAANMAQQFVSGISQNFFRNLKEARPDVPDRAFDVMNRELTALFAEKLQAPDGLLERTVPVYDKHFTHAEIRELIAFYQTRLGRKTIAVLPKVVGESMVLGEKWGESLRPEIERRVGATLRKEGLLPPGK